MIRQRCSLNVQACFGGGSVRRVWVSCTKNANIELVPGSSGLTSESFETGHSSELNISELSCRGLPFLLSSTYFARIICTPSFLILHVIQKFTPTDKAWCQALPGARCPTNRLCRTSFLAVPTVCCSYNIDRPSRHGENAGLY
jgi:hypothetical protein